VSAAPASPSRHDVQRAGREAGLLGDAREGQRGEAGLLGRLEHAGIAHRQRRADAAAEDLHRVVPGHDVAGHAVRLAPGERGVAVQVGDRLAMHLVGRAAVELEVARQRDGIGAALLERLADIRASSRASSSTCSSTLRPIAASRPRSAAVRRPHSPSSAARAAATAASTSSAPPRAISVSVLPSDGLASGSVCPPLAARQRPP
jgi:GNAT superfamily N-acetyltransferase